jgi:PST family polysaccharide transporter
MMVHGDYFVLGLFASKPEVGAYFVAFRLAVHPLRMLAGSLYTVLFPVLVTLRSEPVRQREAALSACRVLAFITMPLCFMQAAVTRPVFGLFFGSKWDGAIVPAEILSIALGFDAVSWIAAALLSARGEFRRLFIYTCIYLPLFFLPVFIGAYLGAATGVAIAVSLFYVIFSPCFSFAVFRRAGASLRDVATIYVNSTAIAAIAIGAAVALAQVVPTGSIGQIGIVVTFGGGLYLLVLRVVAPLTYNQIKERVVDMILRKRPVIEGDHPATHSRKAAAE